MREKIIDLLYAENVRSDCGIERLADEICATNPARWIPVSDRLPSEGENVLLCNILFGNVAIGKLIRYNTSCCWEVDHWDCDIEDWQVWMPLPEPWRGEEDDDRDTD